MTEIFAQSGLFARYNAYVPESRNEEGMGAISTISIFDSYDMNTVWFKFGHDIFNDLKIPRL